MEIMPYGELYPLAEAFILRRGESPARAWPAFGRDVVLVEEPSGSSGSLLFSCRTNQSMSNPMGVVHGGITASLVDTCMGITCASQAGGAPTPTITMTVNYARPIPLDTDILVRTHTARVGNSSGQMSAEVFLPDRPEAPLATATGVYSVRGRTFLCEQRKVPKEKL